MPAAQGGGVREQLETGYYLHNSMVARERDRGVYNRCGGGFFDDEGCPEIPFSEQIAPLSRRLADDGIYDAETHPSSAHGARVIAEPIAAMSELNDPITFVEICHEKMAPECNERWQGNCHRSRRSWFESVSIDRHTSWVSIACDS